MILIDASMLAHRTHARMDFLKNSNDQPTGMEFGFLRSLQMLQRELVGLPVCVCFDSPAASASKRVVEPNYKADRQPKSKSFYRRLNALRKFVNVRHYVASGEKLEADDVMYTIASTTDGPHYIYTNDDDLLQCVNDKRGVQVVKSFKSKLFYWNEAKVREKYGVRPSALPVLRAFIGDKSDGLPGVERINKKYMASLVNWWYGHKKTMTQLEWLEEVKTADWPKSMRPKIVRFIEGGQFHKNLGLMLLRSHTFDLQPPTEDMAYELLKLVEWEIRSLDICKDHKEEMRRLSERLLANEEF